MDEMEVISQLIVELKRGTQVLAVLSQLNQKEYGYSLLQSLESKSVVIEAGTLYPLLRRLESQGLLESTWDTSDTRPRKYYVLSTLGNSVLTSLKVEWQEIVNQMHKLLEEK